VVNLIDNFRLVWLWKVIVNITVIVPQNITVEKHTVCHTKNTTNCGKIMAASYCLNWLSLVEWCSVLQLPCISVKQNCSACLLAFVSASDKLLNCVIFCKGKSEEWHKQKRNKNENIVGEMTANSENHCIQLCICNNIYYFMLYPEMTHFTSLL